MRPYLKSTLMILILPIIIFAQIDFLPINVDYASFQETDSSAFIEVYVSLFQGNLTYQQQPDSLFKAVFNNQLEIYDTNGNLLHQFTHNLVNTTADTSKLAQFNQFVDIFPISLPYGNYKAKIQVVDNISGRSGQYVFDLNTIRCQDHLFLSDLEFCMNLSKAQQKDRFYKNGLRVVPNPRPVYDILQPMLYFYVELNNLSYDPQNENHYRFRYVVINNQGDTLKASKPFEKVIQNPNMVEIGGFNVMALPQNNYFLVVQAEDLKTHHKVAIKKPFYVFKGKKRQTQEQYAEQEAPEVDEALVLMTKDQLKKEFDMAQYLATRKEEQLFKKLKDANAMRKFLTQFWYRRDKAQNTPFGTFRINYLRRVQEANDRFHVMGKEGWQTDRGRVLLVYGEPDEIERHPSSMDQLPYEIWYYHNLEGGAEFVFVDEQGFGEYYLVHSTYRKELQNPNWRQDILSKKSGFLERDKRF